MIWRFDDVCINANMNLIDEMTDFLFNKFKECQIIYGVSPLVHKDCGQRVYPKIFNAYSDIKNFYKPTDCGLPRLRNDITLAGHGLLHCDHRLLTKEIQELSILASCSLIGADMFVPPFNKWNADTVEICRSNNIRLIKFESGWRGMEHNVFDKNCEAWYLHAREWTMESFMEWFE